MTSTPAHRHSALIALTLGALICLPLHAQTSTTPPRTIIVIDPAHGGPDTGSQLTDDLQEKEVTLALAARLRTTLTASGFTVLTTRDTDPTAPLPADQRASVANHAHALACIVLHATTSGSGIHLATSTLSAAQDSDIPTVLPWDTAQAAYLPQSLRLANQLGVTLITAKLPTLLGRTSVRPIDNLTCPALTLEVAPLPSTDTTTSSDPTPVSDPDYQQRIAQAVTTALSAFRSNSNPTPASPAKPPTKTRPPVTPAAKPGTKPAVAPAPATKPAAKPAPVLPATPAPNGAVR